MSVRRVAVIFDSQSRPETTGNYCLRALKQLADVQHYLPTDFDRVPRHGVDLYLNIDDGLHYRLPVELHPCAWWAIDTHLDFEWCLEKAHDFDFVFAAQQDGALQLCDEGISTRWLPLACDPEVHRRHEVAKQHDVCFVGHVFDGPRAALLALIQKHYSDTFVGQRYFEEMAKTYSASKIVFNRSIRNDVNMRVFEALACGSLLLTNDLRDNGQEELFRDGEHLATYTDAGHLLDRLAFYLAHHEERDRIAAAGRQEVLGRHTYRHRMACLLKQVESALARRVIAVSTDTGTESAGPVATPAEGEQPGVNEAAGEPAGPGAGVDPGYYEFARPEILALIPGSASKVLEVGCGAGRLGEALKARQPVEVTGLELVQSAAAAARNRLDRVLTGDVETMDLPFAPETFDTVVCGDVLEHLAEPAELLRRARSWLTPGGRLVASIPNVRHHSVVRSLLDGNWTYESAGLLDRTHLRFFTRRGIEQLFQDTGFVIDRVSVVPGPGHAEWTEQGRPSRAAVGHLRVETNGPGEAEEFFAYQYLVTASPALPGRAHVTAADTPDQPAAKSQPPSPVAIGQPSRRLRLLFVGDFATSWRHETLVANGLVEQGHEVRRLHEYLVPSADAVVAELNSGRYDALLFYKGRIGPPSQDQVFAPTGEEIAEVVRRAAVPCYTWYVDRAYEFPFQPSREAWLRRVAPLCRVAFVAEAALARTSWARWQVLREPADGHTVRDLGIPDEQRRDVAFLGQLYGPRAEELAPVQARFPLQVISGVYGADLGRVVQGHKIILGPRYPCVPGYWGNRLQVVLAHGGFFLAPEVPGMREAGFVPGVHYARLGDDPVADIEGWLARPADRERIAHAGRQLVLERYTYRHAVAELVSVIARTLDVPA